VALRMADELIGCDERPPLSLVLALTPVSATGCLLALWAAVHTRAFEVRLTACLAFAVFTGLPVWLLPDTSSFCLTVAMLEQFSFLSSMCWAVVCMLHIYLVVNTGYRVAWRLEALAHAVGWGVPLVSVVWLQAAGAFGLTELGACWISTRHVASRVLAYFGPLAICFGAMLWLLALVTRQMTRGVAAQPEALRLAKRRKLAELACFLLAFLLLNLPALRVHTCGLLPQAIPEHSPGRGRSARLGAAARASGRDASACRALPD
jgi:hypothetical protein